MKRAIIIYQSKTGTTKKYAQEISAYMQEKQITTFCLPVDKYREGMLILNYHESLNAKCLKKHNHEINRNHS